MKLVVASMVRNEEDILEVFLRYHCSLADRVLLTLHRCTDASADIAAALQREGLPIEVAVEQRLQYVQSEVITASMHHAANELGADWFVPLDADEFLSCAGDVRAVLARRSADTPLALRWKTYVPWHDDGPEPNTVRRLRCRLRREPVDTPNLVLPAGLARREELRVELGNHWLTDTRTGKGVRARAEADLWLAHYPVRSVEQLHAKVVSTWPALRARATYRDGEGWHCKRLYERFASGPVSASELPALAVNYFDRKGSVLDAKSVVHDPLPLPSDIVLRYTPERPWRS
jgi:Glycosyl transferase family 2